MTLQHILGEPLGQYSGFQYIQRDFSAVHMYFNISFDIFRKL